MRNRKGFIYCLVDNGNNNGIASLARANYFPYGIYFQNGPTRRFSNGMTTVDVISNLLGFKDFIPSYASASGEQITRGVNYASAAAGIREETGQQLGARIPFSGQVRNYQKTVSQIVNIIGDVNEAATYLRVAMTILTTTSCPITTTLLDGTQLSNMQIFSSKTTFDI